MSTRLRRVGVAVVLPAALTLAGCYGVMPSGGRLQTKAPCEATFRAAAQALVGAGFSVKSSDINTGTIYAERIVRMSRQDRAYTFNVAVRPVEASCTVHAQVKQPPGALGGTQIYYDLFVKELRTNLGDVVEVGKY